MKNFKSFVLLNFFLICLSHSIYSSVLPKVSSVTDIKALYMTSVDEVHQKTEQIIREFHEDIKDYFEQSNREISIENTLSKWDEVSWKLLQYEERFLGFSMVEKDPGLRAAYGKACQSIKETFISTLAGLPELYEHMKCLNDKILAKEISATKQEVYYLNVLLNQMRVEGLHLSNDKRNMAKQLKIELSKCSHDFEKNIREDNKYIYANEEDLDGVSPLVINSLERFGDQLKLTCDYPIYFSVMRSCKNEQVRKDLFRLFTNRAAPQNLKVLSEMIKKRDQLSKIIGFNSYAHMELSTQMAQSPEKVQVFLNGLRKKTSNHEYFDKLKDTLGGNFTLNIRKKIDPWNVMFYEEEYRKKALNIDQEKIREYFPLNATISGLIHIYESFFGLNITQVPVEGLWDKDVKLLKLQNKGEDKVLGFLILDLFPRENKYSHACHVTMLPGIFREEEATPTVSLVIANFPKSSHKHPSLLSHQQVKTFFHEFGHGIHAILGKTQFIGTSGTSVKVDFVELPSQILEEWLWDKSILKKVSSHYVTKEPLPDEIIDCMVKSRQLASEGFVKRQSLLSLISLHYFLEGEEKDTSKIYECFQKDLDLVYSYDPESNSQASFGHLDEYGSRYYGYLWSRVFAIDLFEKIKKKGLLNPEMGKLYRKHILEKGGSEDPEDLLKAFLEREPSQEPFLRLMGIASNES